jgi:hypothetical protein
MNLQSLAKSLNGEVSGRVILAPGPNHSPKDRSMTVTIDRDAPDGFLVHSFSGDDFRDCRDYIKTIIGGRTFERQQEPITPTKLDNLIYAKQSYPSKQHILFALTKTAPLRVRKSQPWFAQCWIRSPVSFGGFIEQN